MNWDDVYLLTAAGLGVGARSLSQHGGCTPYHPDSKAVQ